MEGRDSNGRFENGNKIGPRFTSDEEIKKQSSSGLNSGSTAVISASDAGVKSGEARKSYRTIAEVLKDELNSKISNGETEFTQMEYFVKKALRNMKDTVTVKDIIDLQKLSGEYKENRDITTNGEPIRTTIYNTRQEFDRAVEELDNEC